MTDIALAKETLIQQHLSLVVARSGEVIFTSKASGVIGLLQAIKSRGSKLARAAVADRVIGKAAALLCVYSQVSDVYAVVLSEPGKQVLEKSRIPTEYQSLVPNILDRNRTGVCPFEKLTENIESSEQAYQVIADCLHKAPRSPLD